MFSYFFSFLPLWILNGVATDIVLAPRGMLAKGALSIKPLKKRIYLYVCKLFGLVANICFQATSEQEVLDIKAVFGSESQITLAPNIPAAVPEINNHLDTKSVGSLKLISVARIAPEKNLLYALNVLRNVKGKVCFDIYGVVYSEGYWNSCMQVIDKMPENITVAVHEGVPRKEMFERLQESHFLLMPSKSENFGHIIWESLACGIPVIISDQTPWLNLEEKNIGFDISLASESKFVAAIESCIDMGREEYTLKSDSAYNFAKTYAANSDSIELSRELFTQIRGNSSE
jgi:glycosyltransferase involved in cell wall biosynthesis